MFLHHLNVTNVWNTVAIFIPTILWDPKPCKSLSCCSCGTEVEREGCHLMNNYVTHSSQMNIGIVGVHVEYGGSATCVVMLQYMQYMCTDKDGGVGT